MNILTVENVKKSYGLRVLFDDVTFAIDGGQKLGLIGFNGAGKTTLLKIIAGLTDTDSGTIWRNPKARIHYLPQEPQLVSGHTVLESVLDGDLPVMKLLQCYEEAVQRDDDAAVVALSAEMDEQQAWELEAHAKIILSKLGISNFSQSVDELSGAQARSTKQKARKERYEQLCAIEAGKPIGEVEMFDTSVRLGKTIIDIDDMAFGYDPAHPLFQHVTYHVVKHDRIGIIGENGVGKSTLLKVLAGQLAPTEGTVTIGQTVRFGFFTQQLPQFDEGMRVIDYVQEHGHFVTNQFGQRISATRLLDQFLFTEEMQYTYIAKLSGGERRRLYLLRLLMDQPNVLLLDEPTNDLDIPTLTVLERYLDTFQGVVLVVSHDRYFLDRVVDKLFTLEKGTWDRFYGDYSEYLEEKYSHHQEKKSEKPVSPSITKTNITPTKAKAGLTSRQEEELRRITEELPRYEAMLKGLNAAIAAAGSNYEEVESLLAEQKETQDKVDTLTERWCELEDLKS